MKTKHKILLISDTHTLHEDLNEKFDLPAADFIIHCGDITGRGSEYNTRKFLDWFNSLYQYDNKIFIAGNHDWLFETSRTIAQDILKEYPDIHYLEDSGVELWGVKFWGSPVTRPFNNWAFNREEDKLAQHWEMIPEDIDVLITHGPPYQILDFVNNYMGCENTGSPSLLHNVLYRVKPQIHCFGHIHETYGQKEVDGVKFINASLLDGRYHLVNPPILVEVEV